MSDLLEIPISDGALLYHPTFLNSSESERYFEMLLKEVTWEQHYVKMFGKTLPAPRLSAWYGEAGKTYAYSGVRYHPTSFTPSLLELKQKVETFCMASFNSVLLNNYRNENDSMGWHADDEKELGTNPLIASVSLGATRRFMLKHKYIKQERFQLPLQQGSLLIMKGETQHYWLHQLPKSKLPCAARINLTFRFIY